MELKCGPILYTLHIWCEIHDLICNWDSKINFFHRDVCYLAGTSPNSCQICLYDSIPSRVIHSLVFFYLLFNPTFWRKHSIHFLLFFFVHLLRVKILFVYLLPLKITREFTRLAMEKVRGKRKCREEFTLNPIIYKNPQYSHFYSPQS